MTTRPCPTCHNDLSMKADACPRCGHRFRAPNAFDLSDPVHLVLVVVVGLVVLAFLWIKANG